MCDVGNVLDQQSHYYQARPRLDSRPTCNEYEWSDSKNKVYFWFTNIFSCLEQKNSILKKLCVSLSCFQNKCTRLSDLFTFIPKGLPKSIQNAVLLYRCMCVCSGSYCSRSSNALPGAWYRIYYGEESSPDHAGGSYSHSLVLQWHPLHRRDGWEENPSHSTGNLQDTYGTFILH